MRWLMPLGERTRPDVPSYADCPAPDKSRALALVDDFGHLFTVPAGMAAGIRRGTDRLGHTG
ncbi:hypothetical protein ACF08N_37445 [Streptomyces sp. NPDC015127]|uniref:hypothetical protein n=1 Tax=Streptomyces sp. NPDC015127 TaxID=3364939 RepID=UPI0036FE92D7